MVQGLGNGFIGSNSISDFNRVFNSQLQNVDKGFDQASMTNFDEILEAKNQEARIHMANPLKTGIEINAGNVNIPNFDTSSVNGIQTADNITSVQKVHSNSEVANTMNHFSSSFSDGLSNINAKQLDAQGAVETLAAGGDISVHEVMIAAEKANLSMQMGLQLRNKILAAYNELYNVRI